MTTRGNSVYSQGGRTARPEIDSKSLSGLWPATVEYVLDPLQQGRIRVRIWHIHGPHAEENKENVPLAQLPWAMPCFPGAGGEGYGSFIVPPVGSRVIVGFLSNDPDQPVYFGGWPSIPYQPQEFLRLHKKPEVEISMAGTDDKWTGNKGPEVPSEALEMLHTSPEIAVPFRSPKGASIAASDVDERESFLLTDRAGQVFGFEAEVKKDVNLKNAARRGPRTLARGKSPINLDSDTVAGETRIFLIDGAGQSVLLQAKSGFERVRIVSRPVEQDTSNPAGAKAEVSLDLDAGTRRATIATSSGGGGETRVTVDAASGHVEISGPLTIRLVADVVQVAGNLMVEKDLSVGGNVSVSGDVAAAGTLVGEESS